MSSEARPPFDEFVSSRWGRLVRTAVLMGADQVSAEDHVQTALLRCYTSWDRVMRAHDLDAYVHRAVLNAAHDSRRRRWTGETPTYPLPERTAAATAPDVETVDAMRTALARLPFELRQVIVLRYYADLTEPQTAATLGIPLGTVKSRANRAITALEQDPDLTEFSSRGDPHE